MISLYQQLGGEPAVERAVDILYSRVLGDDGLAPFFDGLDMATQKRKFRLFLNTVTGGPYRRTEVELRAAHAHAVDDGLTEEHFAKFIAHLRAALNELQTPGDIMDHIIKRIASTHDDVLGL